MKAALVLACVAAALVAAAAPAAAQVTDVDVLNFALNLEYLEGEFYSYAVYGRGLPSSLRGRGGAASVGGRKYNFNSPTVKKIAVEIAIDEINHVKFLRLALGSAAVAMPRINIGSAFSDAADAALKTKLRPRFTPYLPQRRDLIFLHGAFIFEDVGVTAYKGAAPLIADKGYLSAAAGILSVEAYHAGTIRTLLYQSVNTKIQPYGATVLDITWAISRLRGKVGGGKDQGLVSPRNGGANIVAADGNSIAFGRTTSQVLKIVYLGQSSRGGFFPNGLNGKIKTA